MKQPEVKNAVLLSPSVIIQGDAVSIKDGSSNVKTFISMEYINSELMPIIEAFNAQKEQPKSANKKA